MLFWKLQPSITIGCECVTSTYIAAPRYAEVLLINVLSVISTLKSPVAKIAPPPSDVAVDEQSINILFSTFKSDLLYTVPRFPVTQESNSQYVSSNGAFEQIAEP